MRGVECSEQHMYVSETRFVTMHRHRRHHVHGESPCEMCVDVYSPLIHDANGCSQLFLLIALDHPLMRFPNSTRIHTTTYRFHTGRPWNPTAAVCALGEAVSHHTSTTEHPHSLTERPEAGSPWLAPATATVVYCSDSSKIDS